MTERQWYDGNLCTHYDRNCRIVAPCCKKMFGCRLCHDEKSDHKINRHAIKRMQCNICFKFQRCAQVCRVCTAQMAEYYCQTCKLFDNNGLEKGIFHCEKCGICRVGGQENFYHCNTCCGCYQHSLRRNHTCLAGAMHRECAVCLEITFDSLEVLQVLKCGHVLHQSCWGGLLKSGMKKCPTCRVDVDSTENEDDDCFGIYEDDTESEISIMNANHAANDEYEGKYQNDDEDSDSDDDYVYPDYR